jgi:hypothetical protein
VYKHVDRATGIPFYIGIGTNNNSKSYKRSKDKNRRSQEWKDYVTSINYNYDIEILFETNDYLLINKKEREFVKLYGRKDKNLGTLLNKDNAGNGKRELSQKSIDSMISKQKLKSIIVYNSLGEKVAEFDRAQSASTFTKVPYLSIKQCLMKKQHQSKGFRFLYKINEVDNLKPLEYKKFNRDVKVECYNVLTKEVTVFSNMTIASKSLNIPFGTIGNNLKGVTKLVRNKYKFNYI